MSRAGGFVVQLAGTRLHLSSRSEAWLELVRQFLGPWEAEGKSGVAVTLRADPEDCGIGMGAVPAAGNTGCLLSPTVGGFSLQGSNFAAEVELRAGQAVLRGPVSLAPLLELLRHLLPVLTVDGLVVHGVGLAGDGRGWVGSGPSGCGKSTLARLFPHAAMSEELVAVRRREGGFVVEGLPFWGRAPRQVPLEGLLFLQHGRGHRRLPLSPGQALQRLAAQVLWPSWVPGRMAASFALAVELVQEVGCYELAFAPEPGVWPVLTGQRGAA